MKTLIQKREWAVDGYIMSLEHITFGSENRGISIMNQTKTATSRVIFSDSLIST